MKTIIGVIKITVLIILSVILVLGCSGNPTAPEMPGPDGTDIQEYAGNRSLWGVWDLGLNVNRMEITTTPRREINPHFDITLMITPPKCDNCVKIEILEFKPQQKYAKLKLTLTNNTAVTGYDVRGIIESDAPGFRITNPDSYTGLWDTGGAIAINPFKAFAISKPSREFTPGISHSMIYEIGFDNVSDLSGAALIVDASWPGNCKEPYEIKNFVQGSSLQMDGGVFDISFDVLDWQYDADNVFIDATPIGGAIIALDHGDGNTWSCTISTDQSNFPGAHRLHVYAGSTGTNLRLHNYFNVNVSACSPEGNEIPETGSLLLVGENSAAQVVCLDDKTDWYLFPVTNHLFGKIRLEVLDQYGPADLAIFSDPHGSHLKWVQATFGEDGVLNVDPLNLGPGTYYLRVRHIGNDFNPRNYILYNNTGDSVCFPDGNNSYNNAVNIPPQEVTEINYVCPVDKQDWFSFSYEPGNGQYLRLSVSNDIGPADMTLYSAAQAGNPDGPHLAWKQADPLAVMNLDDLGIIAGEYFLRVRHIGSDTDYREYRVFNLSWDVPCLPEGNESADTPTELPMGEDSGVQVVCLDDQVDWYNFVATDNFMGDILFTLLNDSGDCEISLYPQPPITPIFTYTATSETPVNIDLNFNPGIYYLKVRFLGEDTGIRQYIIDNKAFLWPCHPEGNESAGNADILPYGDTGPQEICWTDLYDYYEINATDHWSGDIRVHLLNDSGPLLLNLYLYPGPTVIFGQVIEYGTDVVFNFDNVDMTDVDYIIARVGWAGDEGYDVRQYILYNYTQAWPCLPDDSNSWDQAVPIPNGTETGYGSVCHFDIEDWYSVTTEELIGGNIIVHASNSHYEPASVEFFDNPNNPPLIYQEFYTNNEAVLNLTPLHLGSGTFYLRIAYFGDDYLVRAYKISNNIVNIGCDADGNDSYSTAFTVPQGEYIGPDYVCQTDPQDWFKFDYSGDPGVYLKTQVSGATGPVDITLYDAQQAQNPDGSNITSDLADPVSRINLGTLGLSSGTYYARVRFVGSDESVQRFFVGYMDPNTGWARAYGLNGDALPHKSDYPDDIAAVGSDDIYVSGTFEGDDDFDPGPGNDIHHSFSGTDGMIARYTSAGDYVWGISFSRQGDTSQVNPTDIAVNGNYIYIAGGFTGIVDFDTGAGQLLVDAQSNTSDCFLSMYDTDGNFIWNLTWGGINTDSVQAIAMDDNGDLLIIGLFELLADFDPGPGVDEHSGGSCAAYLMKLDSDGNYQWVRTWAGYVPYEGVNSIAINPSDDIFVSGYFYYTEDLDPSSGVDEHTSMGDADPYISKFDSSGTFLGAKSWGGTGSDIASCMAFDPFGNLFVSGYFSDVADLDPGAGVAEFTAGGLRDAFVMKLNSSMQYVNAFTWGGTDTENDLAGSESLVADSSGILYLTGTFRGTVDFDQGGGVMSLTSTNIAWSDIFTASYGPSGNAIWVNSIGTGSYDDPGEICVTPDGKIYSNGNFGHIADFDPGPSEYWADAGQFNRSAFLLKYLPGGVW